MSNRHIASAFLVAFQLTAGAAVACGIPTAGPDGWPVAAPETVGLDGAALCRLGERFAAFTEANVHGVLVIRRGTLVYEQYFAGEDQNWGEPLGRVSFKPDTKHDLRSITKTVISLLVGIAVERKLIAGVDEPVFKFFPEYADLRSPEKDRILLRHLLTMSGGLEWDENTPYTDFRNSEIAMILSPDPHRFALAPPVAIPAGEMWNYNGGGTELLGAVVRKTAGRPLDDFAREVLFAPLGITDVAWAKYPTGGTPAAASGLRLRPRDMAKLGQLMLRRGQWNGRQVVPAQWIDDSITPQIGGPGNIWFYGYQWWLGRSLLDKREIVWATGAGLGGQRLFVVPALDLVVAVTAGLYASPMQSWVPLQILNRHVLAAVKE